MNAALGAVALAATLAAAPGAGDETIPAPLEYALPDLGWRCVAKPCRGVLVADLGFAVVDPGGPDHGRIRLRLVDRFYLGARADGSTRGLTLSAARWDVAVEDEDERTALEGEYRAPRARARATAERDDRGPDDGWRLGLEAALRLSPDLELTLELTDDDRPRLGFDRTFEPTSAVALGALWQRGDRLDLSGRLVSATVETAAGFELDSREVGLEAVYQARHWRLAGSLQLEDLSGRLERRLAEADLRLAVRITSHLVTETSVRERHELDLGSLERDVEASLTYYVRRFHFARGGEAGARTVALARRAGELGFNERRQHDPEGRRRLRERLASAGAAAADLETLIADLYRAQIEERNVALGGISWRRDADNLVGSRYRELTAFFAIPWPNGRGPHRLIHDEAAVDFLRFTYQRSERAISAGFATRGTTLAMDIALNRELELRFAWEDPAATGLDFALQTQKPGRLSARVDYRLGI